MTEGPSRVVPKGWPSGCAPDANLTHRERGSAAICAHDRAFAQTLHEATPGRSRYYRKVGCLVVGSRARKFVGISTESGFMKRRAPWPLDAAHLPAESKARSTRSKLETDGCNDSRNAERSGPRARRRRTNGPGGRATLRTRAVPATRPRALRARRVSAGSRARAGGARAARREHR